MAVKKSVVATDRIERSILLIRGHRVMLDADLAELYGVSTRALNQAVKRNRSRFPSDFMFRLTKIEKEEVITNCDHLQKLKFSPAFPNAFTEHGAIMLASVLNSQKAIAASIYVVRVFVRLREMLGTHKALARKITELESRIESHDEHIRALFDAIRQLMVPSEKKKRRIGFIVSERASSYGKATRTGRR